METLPPTIVPSLEPIMRSVPTLSFWGFMSLAVVLGFVAVGVILAKRNKASA